MLRISLACPWFGVQLLFGRGWSEWHDHEWNAITLFPGRLKEQVDGEGRRICDMQKTKWFINRVPHWRYHRVKYPLFMIILHGKKQNGKVP